MDPQAQKAFDKLNAKLDIINKEIDGMKASVEELSEFDEKVEKVIEDKVFEIKGIVYMVLIIVTVLLALVIGALLRAYVG